MVLQGSPGLAVVAGGSCRDVRRQVLSDHKGVAIYRPSRRQPCTLEHSFFAACALSAFNLILECSPPPSPGVEQRGEIHELKEELHQTDKAKQKEAVKKVRSPAPSPPIIHSHATSFEPRPGAPRMENTGAVPAALLLPAASPLLAASPLFTNIHILPSGVGERKFPPQCSAEPRTRCNAS